VATTTRIESFSPRDRLDLGRDVVSAGKASRLTQRQRRSVRCPTCGQGVGSPCQGSRIPSASTLGGGWGGPPPLEREHPSRVAAVRERRVALRDALCACDDVSCWSCGSRERQA